MKVTPPARALNEAAAVWLPLDVLRPNPRNPRAHGAEVNRLARTIVRTTWGAPIIAQAGTCRIIGGHGRLEAARLILAGIEVDGIARGGPEHRFDRDAPGPGVVPVRLVDVSDAEADAMTLADNARTLQGTDDAAALVAMATLAFERDAPTMADMGYGAAELDALVKAAGDSVLAAAGAVEEDAIGDGTINGAIDESSATEEAASKAQRVASFDVFSRDAIVESAFSYFRAAGFPYYDLPLHVQQQQVNKLHSLDGDALLRTDTAYHVADTYNRHRLDAGANSMKAPRSSFDDDDMLRRALVIQSERFIGDGYFDALKFVRGTQECSNFRPGFAAYLYRKFGGHGGIVLDPSTGYGGRLVGWIASGLGGRYVGVDPNTLTFNANTRLAKALAPSGAVSLIHSPFEDADLSEIEGQVSFVFTSPPYFAKEIYSDEPTQSWKRYPTCDEWTRGFLARLLSKSFTSLRSGGTCVINIADVSIKGTTYDLEKRTVDAGIAAGFKHIDTLRFEMSRRFGSGSDDVATEPCFVFSKA